MKKLAVGIIVGMAVGFGFGMTHNASAKNVDDEFRARMYESNQDDRDEAAIKSGNAKAFMAGFDFAVDQAEDDQEAQS